MVQIFQPLFSEADEMHARLWIITQFPAADQFKDFRCRIPVGKVGVHGRLFCIIAMDLELYCQ
jgi:hypothetical protein